MGKQINYYLEYEGFLKIAEAALQRGCEIFKKRRQRNYPQRRYIGCFSRRFDYYFDYAPAGEVSIKNLRRRAGIR